jgi:hypothetical protein
MLEIIVNGQKVKGSASEIAELLGLMETSTAASATPKKASKAASAIEQPKAKDTAPRIEVKAKYAKMADTAIKRAADKHGIALNLETSERYNQGKDNDGKPVFHWVWLRCTDGKLNRDNGKQVAASMPKGWVYSPRRNAIRRDMGEDIRKK